MKHFWQDKEVHLEIRKAVHYSLQYTYLVINLKQPNSCCNINYTKHSLELSDLKLNHKYFEI